MASERLRLAAAVAALASVLAASPARAEPTAADRNTAREMMREGRDLRDKGDLKGALKRFKAADDIMHVPTTGLEVARTQVALGLLVEARDSIAEIRQEPQKADEPQPFKEAREKAEELDSSLRGRVPALTIAVHGAAPDAKPTITVDGVTIPDDLVGLPRSVDPGHHVVVVTTSNGQGKQEVDVREGEKKPVDVTLVATENPAQPAQVPETPPPAPETPPPAPEPTTTRSHRPTLLTYAGFALAGVGIAAGTTTGLMSMSTTSSLSSSCPNHVCGPSSYSDLDSANTMALLSTISFAAAGVGAAVAVVSMIVGHEEASPAPAEPPSDAQPAGSPSAFRVHATPWIGLGSAGVSGTF